jgi:hypothetical protein
MLVTTYLPKTVEIDGKEMEIDKNSLSDLRLYVPPQVVNKVIEAILKAGYYNSTDKTNDKPHPSERGGGQRFFQYNITDCVDHIIKIDRDGTIESYFKYKDLTLPTIFETYSHYRHIYDKLHILYRGRLIDRIGSLYECQFLNITDFPAPVVTIGCKEPEQVYSMYMYYITKG